MNEMSTILVKVVKLNKTKLNAYFIFQVSYIKKYSFC